MADLLPLFPLHTVLFPGAVLPLHIFEPRYRRLVEEGADFGVVMIREGREVGGEGAGQPFLHEVGSIAHPERVEALPDGRYNLLVRGLERFRVGRLDDAAPYLRSEFATLPEVPPSGPRLARLLQEYLGSQGVEVLLQHSEEFAARGTWLAGSLLQVEPAKLQRLLESGDAGYAESLLVDEIRTARRIGRLNTVTPRGSSPN